jgi:tRNA (cmo5U34)-methyltransferase
MVFTSNKTGQSISKKNSDWNFKGNVYKNFDKHIIKSVPFYKETQDLYLQYTDFFLQNNARIIDLGCSTGTFINKVFHRHKENQKKIKFLGVDNTSEMIKFCKLRYKQNKNIKFVQKDIEKL